MKNSDPKSDLEPIPEVGTIRRYLYQASQEMAPIILNDREKGAIHRMKIVSFEDKSGDFYLAAVDGAQVNLTSEQKCLINLNFTLASLFFAAEFVGDEGVGFRFKFPEVVYAAQRRKHLRLQVPSGFILKMEIPDPFSPEEMTTRKVHDLSEGGLSFFAPPEEEEYYVTGNRIPIRLALKKPPLDLKGIVRHARKMKDRAGKELVKVGVEFEGTAKEARDSILKYIFEQQSRLGIRF